MLPNLWIRKIFECHSLTKMIFDVYLTILRTILSLESWKIVETVLIFLISLAAYSFTKRDDKWKKKRTSFRNFVTDNRRNIRDSENSAWERIILPACAHLRMRTRNEYIHMYIYTDQRARESRKVCVDRDACQIRLTRSNVYASAFTSSRKNSKERERKHSQFRCQ